MTRPIAAETEIERVSIGVITLPDATVVAQRLGSLQFVIHRYRIAEYRIAEQHQMDRPGRSLEELRRFHMLYERTSAALAKMVTFSSEPQTRAYLEHLVARGYILTHRVRPLRQSVEPPRHSTLPTQRSQDCVESQPVD